MNNYNRTLDKLIKKSFPILKEDNIFILRFVLSNKFLAQALNFGFFKLLLINPKKIKKLSYMELEGVFAHELSHFEINKKRTFFQKIVFVISYIFASVRKKEERNVDILTVRKGYGRERLAYGLLMNKRSTKKELDKKYDKGYLTPKEIKKYIKKFRI